MNSRWLAVYSIDNGLQLSTYNRIFQILIWRCWSPVANRTLPINSVIQTVHSVLMRHLSSSTAEILVRAGGGHVEHVM